MLDNITIKQVLDRNDYGQEWLNQLKENFYVRGHWDNSISSVKSYRFFMYSAPFNGQDLKNRPPRLQVIVTHWESRTEVTIENSIRKWFYNDKAGLRNLNYINIVRCIKRIAKLLFIPYDVFITGRLTSAELGGNLLFKNINFEGFMTCIYSHKFIKRKETISDETVAFLGEKKEIILYDKISEMQSAGLYKAKTAKLLKRKLYIVRFEIKIKSISSEKFGSRYMSTLQDFLNNWNLIVNEWLKEGKNLKFVDNISPEISDFLTTNKSESLFKDYLIFKGMEKLGIQNFNEIHHLKVPVSKRPESSSEYLNRFHKFKELKKPSYGEVFIGMLEFKTNQLKIEITEG